MKSSKYIWQNKDFPQFSWSKEQIMPLLLEVKHAQGLLSGSMSVLSTETGAQTLCAVLSQDVLRSSEIEGVRLDAEQVRSSVAHRLGIKSAVKTVASKNVDGFVLALLNATQNCNVALSKARLCTWHSAMFPSGLSDFEKIKTGAYRDDKLGAMQVVSGSIGHEKVFFEAPPATALNAEMQKLIDYVNFDATNDVIKAAVVHLWFVILHPFDDGNGRIARILSDMLLCRSEGKGIRYYSMSAQICKVRRDYYKALEITAQMSLDITDWIIWFLKNLLCAIDYSKNKIEKETENMRLAEKLSAISINERQAKFMRKLTQGFEGKITSSKYAKICNCSQDSATRDLSDLVAKGVLQQEGAGRSVCYLLC